MSDTVIRVKGLSKRYTIGAARKSGRTLVETVTGLFRRPAAGVSAETSFWALKGVDFEVKRGDVAGIIGRNGAGKSTLLKILSRITDPTEGGADISGRVGSLLEVGTGFHPELTGRENVYLNGAILGMRRAEIAKKFDEIVAFAGTDEFLDTPVKHYSSGMYTRLAFAVAAHLEPEILIVDEVLAVGDAEFQKRCLGKMKDVAGQGRTVLFVSHNMNAVEQLCTTAISLERGRVTESSRDVSRMVREYVRGGAASIDSTWTNAGGEFANAYFVPSRFFVGDSNGLPIAGPQRNDADLWVHVEGEVKSSDAGLTIGCAIFNESGAEYFWSYPTDAAPDRWPSRDVGSHSVRARLPKRLLNEGTYRIELIGGLTFRQWVFKPGESVPAVQLTIQGGLSDSPQWMSRRPGLIAPVLEWTNV